MARPWTYTVGPLTAAVATAVALAQTPLAAGNLTLNGTLVSGGVAILDAPRRLAVTTAANESTKTITIYGTGFGDVPITETMVGPNAATATTWQDFKSVTRVTVSAPFTGTVTIGTSAIASSPWHLVNYNNSAVSLGIGVVVGGTVNYTIEATYDEIMGHYEAGVYGLWVMPPEPVVFPDPVAGSTLSDEFQIFTPIRAVRLKLNSGTGTAKATIIEAGIVG